MDDPVIAEGLTKTFKVPVRQAGLRESVKSLFRRQFRYVEAVKEVGFRIPAGEIVGFLGPNGAGKTTTIKMLTGLLHPTSGDARVLGYQPWKRDKDLLRRIALVMGQRNNLQWDLPAADSFLLNKAIYGVPDGVFRERLDDYVDRLEVGALLDKPVRNLSLGERMKMEIIAAMLHGPEVVFLDEPTIGLDVTMQRRLRQFVLDQNKEEGVTVLLTSHYMADVSALAERVIVINQGSLLYDGALTGLSNRFSSHKTIRVEASDLPADLDGLGRVVDRNSAQATLEVERDRVSEVASKLLSAATVTDLSIEDPPLEEVIDRVFSGR
ncbi:MAG TPA: ATP-binding cassette domain-containing protein [Acidimicrobiia bacterium]|nr:ATP-binding cassette domain-containing protein [Acidimicrobiia bacterium]